MYVYASFCVHNSTIFIPILIHLRFLIFITLINYNIISDLVTHSRLIRSLDIIFPDWFRIVYNLISQNSVAFAMSKPRHYVTIMSEFCGRRYPSFLLMVTWPVDSNTKRGGRGHISSVLYLRDWRILADWKVLQFITFRWLIPIYSAKTRLSRSISWRCLDPCIIRPFGKHCIDVVG